MSFTIQIYKTVVPYIHKTEMFVLKNNFKSFVLYYKQTTNSYNLNSQRNKTFLKK